MATKTDHPEEQTTQEEFDKLVNMSASELKKWLTTEESKSVGQKKDGARESTGHQSGEEIVEILGKKGKAMSEADISQMKRVVSYIKRHLAQRPAQVEDSNWMYSLKNWGHDPTKK
ncbi:DUF3140 domain-containing protein [Spirosoma fluviale]|uniref:DNA-binding protein n=1 Tax=Spirosoma fluviale TaxID=1597977 RepID=A0A286G107_9BACT|nr:DUF3140 domain-containing protein [Spirosoma fluviale]SOD89183.1 Protein of unknown function [Spirosoma fluviale]